MLFIDSSALAKRYIQEAGSERVLHWCATGVRIAVSRFTLVELTAALVRRGRAGDIDGPELANLLDQVDHDFCGQYEVGELDPAIMNRSVAIARKHALRAGDALQLACAITCASLAPDKVVLVSCDGELNSAAAREGLVVLNPAERSPSQP